MYKWSESLLTDWFSDWFTVSNTIHVFQQSRNMSFSADWVISADQSHPDSEFNFNFYPFPQTFILFLPVLFNIWCITYIHKDSLCIYWNVHILILSGWWSAVACVESGATWTVSAAQRPVLVSRRGTEKSLSVPRAPTAETTLANNSKSAHAMW